MNVFGSEMTVFNLYRRSVASNRIKYGMFHSVRRPDLLSEQVHQRKPVGEADTTGRETGGGRSTVLPPAGETSRFPTTIVMARGKYNQVEGGCIG